MPPDDNGNMHSIRNHTVLIHGSPLHPSSIQHFFSFFKTLTGKKVQVELKNDIILQGYLHTVDQYMNLKLRDMTVTEPDKYPHLVRLDL